MSAPAERAGVIHDIGYRRYAGTRVGRRGIAASLLASGVLAVFGFGRSGRAKILPFVLLGMTLVPAVVQVGIMSFIGLDADLLNYAGYNSGSSFLVVLFVAAQAPVLFSRDLRSGVISLYLARPLGATAFALIRWASLVLAILAFVLTPLLVLFIGGLTAGASFREEIGPVAWALGGAVVLALLVATVSALVASWTLRRGLAIAGTIMVLMVGLGVTVALKETLFAEGMGTAAHWVSLLSPFALVDAVTAVLGDTAGQISQAPESALTGWLLLLTSLALMAGGLLLLVRRYRSKGA
ncbi:hypothetical protein [Serinicoccus marinus]|uniref:hypothetical protein n=1 Tax=Serinicoccus marinus TaxID=247333 RepID=UPI0024937B53|nr:hypothetical protein [Serinicoccus marinus]